MKFVLEEQHRNIPSENLLEDLKRVVTLLNTNTLTQAQYQKYGKYGINTFRKRFGGWNQALERIGLKANVYQIAASKSTHTYLKVSKEEIILDVKRVASILQSNSISKDEYSQYGKYSTSSCYRNFHTWNDVLIASELSPFVRVSGKRIKDSDLFQEIERMWIDLGRQPTTKDVKGGLSKYSLNTYTRHFGSWRKALESFISQVNDTTSYQTLNENKNTHFEKVETKPLVDNRASTIKTTNRNINQRLRFLVLARDNFCCCACGASPAKDGGITQLHVDHIVPWSKGGETTLDNLQTLCSKCNLGKSDMEI